MAGARPPLAPGQRAPDFVLPRRDSTPARLYAVAGGSPTVLEFRDAAIAVWSAERDSPSRRDQYWAGEDRARVEVFADPGGAVRDRYGMPETAMLVLDPNLRVLGTVDGDGPDAAARVEALLAQGSLAGEPREVSAQAPVLLVPRVLDGAACRWLIDVWHAGGSVATGVEASHAGARTEYLSDAHKRRRDHIVTDPEVSRRIAGLVGRALMPELWKAFAYRASRFEGFKIGCYDARDGGFFRAHRDNLSPATAHRRFALTLNLNDDYDGGQLRFPEYGPQRYRPPAGGALVFSCAHLHEVLDVTARRRFVLLSFLSGDDPPRGEAPRDEPPQTAQL